MNGAILIGLRKYVESKLGPGVWKELLDETGIGPRLYMPIEEYPDQEVTALVVAASKRAVAPIPAVLEDFGEFLVPELIAMFGHLIDPRWKTLDLIANTEKTIHEVLRRASAKAKPPRLECVRTSDSEVVVTYTSHRKMCPVAKGIAKGVAKHYGETISMTEPVCMLKGMSKCELRIVLAT